jgi:hypothetical protein
MTGMKFRRTCDRCNITFFSSDRKARFCQKHQPKAGQPDPPPLPARAIPAAAPPKPMPRLSKFVAGAKPHHASGGRREPPPREKAAPKQRPPQSRELTPELRAKIAAAFQQMRTVPGSETPLDNAQTELNLRAIHTHISQQLWVSRALVSQVISEVRTALEAASIDLTLEQRRRATEMYAEYVKTGERPAGGRRRAIANALGVNFQSVVLAIRHWAQGKYAESETPRPSRQQLFEIEKRFWQHLLANEVAYDDLPDVIAGELGFVTPYQALRWIDVLFDSSKLTEHIADVTDDQRKRIIDEYLAYLAADQPPPRSLHPTIAAAVGVSARQVHKTLYDYRVETRAKCLGDASVGASKS